MTVKESISLVIPCYNEEHNVLAMLEHCQETFAKHNGIIEYIFIDDGSRDKTYPKLMQLCQSHPETNIKVIHFSRNFGKEAAMFAGLQHANGDFYLKIYSKKAQKVTPCVILELEFLKNFRC